MINGVVTEVTTETEVVREANKNHITAKNTES